MAERCAFLTTSTRRPDTASPALRLWEKAKELGVWDPTHVGLTRDAEDWRRLHDLAEFTDYAQFRFTSWVNLIERFWSAGRVAGRASAIA